MKTVTRARLRRAAALFVLAAVAALAVAAAGSARAGDADLDPKAMALGAADFKGAKLVEQRSLKATSPVTSDYERTYEAVRIGSKTLALVYSEVVIFTDADAATANYAELNRELHSRAVRQALGKEFAAEFAKGAGGKLKITSVAVSSPVNLGVGQSSLRFVINATTKLGKFTFHVGLMRVDRSMSLVLVVPLPGDRTGLAGLAAVAKAQDRHLRTAFTVTSVTAPAITGTATQTQTLTADTGQWRGAPSSYTYQWSKCDAAGANCADIAGATISSYVVAATDVGSTLRVTVTAANTLTTLATPSALTIAVT